VFLQLISLYYLISSTDMFDLNCLYYVRPNRDCFPTARLCLITDVSRCLIRMLNTSIYVVCSLVSPAWGTTITIEMNTLEVSNTLLRRIRRTWLWARSTFQSRTPCIWRSAQLHLSDVRKSTLHNCYCTTWKGSICIARIYSSTIIKYNLYL